MFLWPTFINVAFSSLYHLLSIRHMQTL
ncbi:hypothetical protein A2U01_0047637, partial [Trifolium medium]|nr:hypothetical protein [Trifolium medium]